MKRISCLVCGYTISSEKFKFISLCWRHGVQAHGHWGGEIYSATKAIKKEIRKILAKEGEKS